MGLNPSSLSRQEKELISSFDLSQDSTEYSRNLQQSVNQDLHYLYLNGALTKNGHVVETVDPDPYKAKQNGIKAGLIPPDSSFSSSVADFFTVQTLNTAYNEANNVRLGTLRLNRFIGAIKHSGYVNPNTFYYHDLMTTPFRHFLAAFGLIYWLEFITEMALVTYSTFVPEIREHEESMGLWQRYSTRFYDSLTKEGRPLRIANDLVWGSLNLAAYFITGGTWPLISASVGFSIDIVLEVAKAVQALKHNYSLYKKVSNEIKRFGSGQPNYNASAEENDLSSLELIKKQLVKKTAIDVAYYSFRVVSLALVLAGMVLIAIPGGAPVGLPLAATGATLLFGSVFGGLGKSIGMHTYRAAKSVFTKIGSWAKRTLRPNSKLTNELTSEQEPLLSHPPQQPPKPDLHKAVVEEHPIINHPEDLIQFEDTNPHGNRLESAVPDLLGSPRITATSSRQKNNDINKVTLVQTDKNPAPNFTTITNEILLTQPTEPALENFISNSSSLDESEIEFEKVSAVLPFSTASILAMDLTGIKENHLHNQHFATTNTPHEASPLQFDAPKALSRSAFSGLSNSIADKSYASTSLIQEQLKTNQKRKRPLYVRGALTANPSLAIAIFNGEITPTTPPIPINTKKSRSTASSVSSCGASFVNEMLNESAKNTSESSISLTTSPLTP